MGRSAVGAAVGVAEEEVTIVVCTSGAGPVSLVGLVQPNKHDKPNKPIKRDKPDRPNRPNEQGRVANCFSMLVSDRCVVEREYISQPLGRLNSRVISQNGYDRLPQS